MLPDNGDDEAHPLFALEEVAEQLAVVALVDPLWRVRVLVPRDPLHRLVGHAAAVAAVRDEGELDLGAQRLQDLQRQR